MAAEPGSPRATVRVLVIDDEEQLRTLMHRVLTRSGYAADGAASVPEARLMDPGGYDIVVVDANLGGEHGTALITELAARDPAVLRRCLLVTGGGAGLVPPGVAYLAKPFRAGDLLAAVQALHAPGPTAPGPGEVPAEPPAAAERRPRHHGPRADPSPIPAGSAPTGPIPAGTTTAGPPPAARQLIGLAGRLRAGERSAVAGLLHDGPVQELTAAMLSLDLLARRAPDDLAPYFGEVRQQLAAAAQPVRQLIDDWAPFLEPDAGLPGTVARRTAWLTFRSVTTEVQHPRPAVGGAAAAWRLPPDLADIIELALFLIAGHVPPGQTDVTVRVGEQAAEVLTLTVTVAGAGGVTGPAGHPAALQAALAELASALGGSISTWSGTFPWRAQIRLPDLRPLAAASGECNSDMVNTRRRA